MGTASRPLRVAVFNPIDPSHPVAERELAIRIGAAIAAKGWEWASCSRSDQVEAYGPDLVLSLHPQAAPKLTSHTWLACHWNPPQILNSAPPEIRGPGLAHEVSYDGYLVSGLGGGPLEQHLLTRLRDHGCVKPLLPFHTSSQRSTRPPQLSESSKAFYVGSNWDGRRFPWMLHRLSQADVLALHGTAERWSHLQQAFCGPLPFDGRSVIEAAHRCGLGLCLHLPSHREAGVPNMRIFELCAAGALVIADRNAFVEHWFGDTVLYVDMATGEDDAAAEILDRVAWARAHAAQGREMAAAAQEIFNRRLSLDTLLEPLPEIAAARATRPRARTAAGETATVVLPWGDGGVEDLGRRMMSLAAQRSRLPAEIGICAKLVVPLDRRAEVEARLPAWPSLRVALHMQEQGGIAAALADAAAGWVAVWPDGARPFPSHLADLTATGAQAALAGVVRPIAATLADTRLPHLDPAETMALTEMPRWTPGNLPLDKQRWMVQLLAMAAGLVVRRECIDDRIVAILRVAAREGPLVEAACLALVVGGNRELVRRPVPSMRIERTPSIGPQLCIALEALLIEAEAPGWMDEGARLPSAGPPSRLTGLNDLDPARAAALPYLREAEDFARVPSEGPIWLYGSSLGGELVLQALPANHRARVAGFLDSYRRGTVRNLPVLLPGDLSPEAVAGGTIIVAAQYVSEIIKSLERLSLKPGTLLNAFPYISDIQTARSATAPTAGVDA